MLPHCSQEALEDPRFAVYIGYTCQPDAKAEWARWAVRQKRPIVSKRGGKNFKYKDCTGRLGFRGLVVNSDRYMLLPDPSLDTNPSPNHSRNRNPNHSGNGNPNPPGTC